MTNPYQQYQDVAAVSAAPSHRNLEANALLATARDLKRIVDDWDAMKPNLVDALERNKALWVFFASEIPDNSELPDELKQNLLNLALFVFKQTLAMFAKPTPRGVEALININRTLAAGLSREPE